MTWALSYSIAFKFRTDLFRLHMFDKLLPSVRAEWVRAFPLILCIGLMWGLEKVSGGVDVVIPQLHYLAVHSVFETSALIFAALTFSLLWMAPNQVRTPGLTVLAVSLAGAAALDFLHMLSYDGMPALVTGASVEKGIAFWLVGRAFMAIGLLAVAFMSGNRYDHVIRFRGVILCVGGMIAAVAAWVVLWHPTWLPATYVPGHGLTAFKVLSEVALIVALLFAAWRLHKRSTLEQSPAIAALAVASALAATGELCFASYSSASDIINALGHIAKIFAYWYITRAAYLITVREPLSNAGGLADALQSTLNPALICNVDGRIRWANKAFLSAYGCSIDSIVGMSMFDQEVPGSEAAWRDMRAAMQAGVGWKGLLNAQKCDGTIFVDDRSVTPMRDPSGALSGFVVLGDDITERERVAAELRTSEERLRLLLKSAPDAVIVIGEKGLVLMANPAVQRMFGYAPEEVVGNNVSMLMPPDVARQHDGFLGKYLESGTPKIIGSGRDVVAQRKDGSALHMHLTVGTAQMPYGKVFIGFMRDISDRIQAQLDLADREARYRALMDTAMDGVWITSMNGRLLAVNDAYCLKSGYTREELLKLHIQDLESQQSVSEVHERIARLQVRGYDAFETRHRTKSGSEWPVEITVTYWPNGNGQLFVFARDLTERHASALALRQSEERFELALRGTNDGLWDRDLVNDTLYFSPRWKEMLGYADHELPNTRETFNALLHPGDALVVQLTLDDIIAGRSADRVELEIRLRHKSGRWVPVLSRGQLVRDADGMPIRFIGTNQDLTERQQAEAALRASEDKLRNLFELSPLGIALCTLDGRLKDFNEAYRVISGHSREVLLNMSYWDLTPIEYMRSEAMQLEHLHRDRRYGPYEKEYVHVDGRRVPVRLNGVRIDLDGEPHIWSIVEDLTESRRLEAERHAMQAQQMQSQKLEALGHLTGGVAHDFNNMLAGIMGLANLGLERFISDKEGKLAQYLREIVRTSERGRDLVSKMLAYVRTEEPAHAGVRDLVPLLEEMCSILKSSIPATIDVTCTYEEDLPLVRIASVDMHQIVMNLVINAKDAAGSQGRIDIHLHRQHVVIDSCIDCQSQFSGDFVVLDVSDNGPGIPDDVLPNIFNPFFTTKEVGRGTGLGLSSVIGLVHKAGGHMQVMRVQPHGTTMRVLLPAAEATAEVLEEPVAVSTSFRGGNASLWVVDDDPAVLVFLTELLREHGFGVTGFADPRHAVNALDDAVRSGDSAKLPVALVTDQTMPSMTGSELASVFLQHCPGLPVILCTGYSELIDGQATRSLGITHFLRKPFDSRDLLSAIESALASRR